MREFYNYLKVQFYSARSKEGSLVSFLIFAVALFTVQFNLMPVIVYGRVDIFIYIFFAAILFGIGGSWNYTVCENTPSLINQLPLSTTKKHVYRYLSVMVLGIVLTVSIIVAFILLILLIGIITVLVEAIKNGLPTDFFTDSDAPPVHVYGEGLCLYGSIFMAAYIVFMYGIGMTLGYLKDNKKRIITALITAVAIIASMTVLKDPFTQTGYDKMQVPALVPIFSIIIACAALGASMYFAIKRVQKNY